MSIADKLNRLTTVRTNVRSALVAKGVTAAATHNLEDFAGDIAGLDVKSWQNFIAVRNRTKTTIEEGDIDVSNFTGINSARFLFSNAATLTSVNLNFQSMGGDGCLSYCFQNCANLAIVRLNLANLSGANPVSSIFQNCSNINNIILDGISNNIIWGQNNTGNNIFAQSQLATCQNLTITVPILPNLYLAAMTSLNFASVVQVLGQLFDYSTGLAHTITFNRSFTGLSQSDYDTIAAAVATATARNWTVSGLTYSL